VPKQRVLFLDNIKILLAILVIIIHLAIIYGGEGGWYYKEVTRSDSINSAFFILLFLLSKSYGLGLFFMMSGLFSSISLRGKKTSQFIKDRLLRLGLPLLLFTFILAPLARSLQTYFVYHKSIDVFAVLKSNIIFFDGNAVGPLWFLELLLIFTFLFVGWNALFPNSSPITPGGKFYKGFPKTKSIIALIAGLFITSFIIRIWFPFGWIFKPLALELADLPQYTAYFIIGLYLPRTNWIEAIDRKTAKKWFIAMASLFALVILILLLVTQFLHIDIRQFAGGLNAYSALFTLWEMSYSVGMNILVLYFFRKKVNKQGKLARFFSKNVYAAFVFHAIVITLLALLLKDIHLYPMLKYLLVAPIAIFASFGVGHLFRIIPGLNKIL